MRVEVKFCGLTRPEDAARAAELGASYAGVIFAGGPRLVTTERARTILDAACATRPGIRRVGVFAAEAPDRIARVATSASLDVIQLHGDPSPRTVTEVRSEVPGVLWTVVRVAGDELPDSLGELLAVADGVVLDARVEGRLGGTGVALPWQALSARLRRLRAAAGVRARLVLAGGLHAGNVGEAVAMLSPDVVDVSSGVESAPGIKDHALMRAFAEAASGDRAGAR